MTYRMNSGPDIDIPVLQEKLYAQEKEVLSLKEKLAGSKQQLDGYLTESRSLRSKVLRCFFYACFPVFVFWLNIVFYYIYTALKLPTPVCVAGHISLILPPLVGFLAYLVVKYPG